MVWDDPQKQVCSWWGIKWLGREVNWGVEWLERFGVRVLSTDYPVALDSSPARFEGT